MQTSDSLPSQGQLTGAPQETIPVRRERARKTPETSMESEGDKDVPEREKTKEELMEDEVMTFDTAKLQKEQDRLTESLRQWGSFFAENQDFLEAQLPFLEQKVKEEKAMLDAIRMRRGRLGDYPDVPKAPRVMTEYAPTEYPRNIAPTVAPEARKRRAQDVGTRQTELPPSDLPN